LVAVHSESLLSTTDPISQLIVGIVLVMLFVLLTRENAHRVLLALLAVSTLWAVTYLTPWHLVTLDGALHHLDLNVLLLLAGMMAVVGVLKATGVFGWLVGRLLAGRAAQPLVVVSLLIWLTGIASAFLDNVTTVIFMAPIALGIATRLRIDPRVMLLPIVMASNIGGAATLIGDPPNIMIGSFAGLSFVDFLVTLTPPILLMIVLLDIMARRRFRTELAGAQHPVADEAVPEITDRRLLRGMVWVGGGILVGFLSHGITGMPAAVPATIGAAAALLLQDVLYMRAHRPSDDERRHGILEVIEHDIEWPTLVFFALLFITVGAAVDTGLISALAHGLEGMILSGSRALGLGTEGTLLFGAMLILFVAGITSGFIDNIPFVAVSIPIVGEMIKTLPGETEVLWWALALGACLGGNLTPIGASANVTTLDLAARQGTRISFREFLRVGVPVTVMTLSVASGWLALRIHFGDPVAAAGSLLFLAALLGGRMVEARRN
jgi:Na+/H+ antiporter NhaD/arsenite permease-like protein